MTAPNPPHQDDAHFGSAEAASREQASPPDSPEEPIPAEAQGGPGGPEQQLEALRAQVDDARQEYLRAVAELDNLRKRSAREVDNARKYGVERLAGELVAVVDSLQMGLEAAQREGAVGALLEGQQTTLKQLLSVLEKFGVTPIHPQGQPFDPEFHEAMSMLPTAEFPPGSVAMVIQTGYLLHDRLLRPARVMVAAET